MKTMTNARVTVYTKSNCPQCAQTKTFLSKHSIPFNEVNMEEDPEVANFLRNQGFMAAPVVETEKESWSGFSLPRLQALAESVATTTDDDWDF